jgi:hypothetical protein
MMSTHLSKGCEEHMSRYDSIMQPDLLAEILFA